MSKPKTLAIDSREITQGFRVIGRVITAMSVIRCLSQLKDDTTDDVTKQNLQIVIDLIHDSKPTI